MDVGILGEIRSGTKLYMTIMMSCRVTLRKYIMKCLEDVLSSMTDRK